MAYKCVHCSQIYADGSQEVLKGCTNCHGKFFFYIKEEQMKLINKNMILSEEEKGNVEVEKMIGNVESPEVNLSEGEKKQMEKDVRELTGMNDEEIPVFLDFESISLLKPGKYLIDLPKLFTQSKPRVYKLEDGKYIIDLAALSQKMQKVEKEGI